jgi:hypothetical protein
MSGPVAMAESRHLIPPASGTSVASTQAEEPTGQPSRTLVHPRRSRATHNSLHRQHRHVKTPLDTFDRQGRKERQEVRPVEPVHPSPSLSSFAKKVEGTLWRCLCVGEGELRKWSRRRDRPPDSNGGVWGTVRWDEALGWDKHGDASAHPCLRTLLKHPNRQPLDRPSLPSLVSFLIICITRQALFQPATNESGRSSA